ncbi:MAG: hypothetical protein R3A51_10430 [Nannocystaceae bacterium]
MDRPPASLGSIYANPRLFVEFCDRGASCSKIRDVDDVGVADPRGRPGLLHEALDAALLLAARGEGLDGDLALDVDVLGEIDLAHSAGAELADDAVAPGQHGAGGIALAVLLGRRSASMPPTDRR